MIARVWHCIAAAHDNELAYIDHFEHTVAPELKQIAGYRSAYLMRRELDDGIEITVMTLWESMDAIRAFAGDTVERAVVEPAAQAVLRTYETTVTHHEIILGMEQVQ